MSMTDHIAELRGSMTALVTPFRDGEVDWKCLDELVERQIDGGVDWLVPCGTTGETPTLTKAEYERILSAVIARCAGRKPVLAGAGSNSTAETVRLVRSAESAGADAVLVVTPYYNRPSQEGLFRHYAKVAEASLLPNVLYNVPARTGVSLAVDTVVRLRQSFPNIMAIKHATGFVDGVTEIIERCDIIVLSGDDPITWPLMSLGAAGVVSVISNLVPELVKSLTDAALAGDMDRARRYHDRVHALAVGLAPFGPNPVPIKTAMAIAGLLREEFRLPLCALDERGHEGIERLLKTQDIREPAVA